MDNAIKNGAVKIVSTEKEDGFMKRLRLGSLFSGRHCRKVPSGFLLFGLVLALCIPPVSAFNIDTGSPEFRIDWDNTVTYNVITRLKDQDDGLIGPEHANTDDGDRNFDKGLVMNRFDLLSELDVVYKTYGVRFSGAAWYDFVYNSSNDNDSPATVNHDSVPYNEFTDETKDLHRSDVELLDAFTFGSFYVGNSMLSYRGGQFAQWWGESFFFGDNGVAGAMAPVDVSKASTLPNTQGKELIRPIPQISATLQFENNIELGAYYQFKFDPARMMATGSYFSFVDLIGWDRTSRGARLPQDRRSRGARRRPMGSQDQIFHAKWHRPGAVRHELPF
jgi:hypothetical protein